MGCPAGRRSAFLPQGPGGRHLAPATGHAERQVLQQLPRRLLQVPPLDLQRIGGSSASPECTGHFDVVSLPYCHIFGDFGKCSWGRGRERRDQLRGGGGGAWGNPKRNAWHRLAGLVLPTLRLHACPRSQRSSLELCRVAAVTGYRRRLLPPGRPGRHDRLTLLARAHRITRAGLGRANSRVLHVASPQLEPRSRSE